MNAHALSVLQFREALEGIAAHASSELGREAVRLLEPADALAWADAELHRVEEMMALVRRPEEWQVPAIPDLRGPLRRLAVEGSVWEPVELASGAVLLHSAREARGAILRRREDVPEIARLAASLLDARRQEEDIRGAVDERGEVRDDASPELARLRREIRGARNRIVERLERFMASLPDRIRVADASVTVRDGRYVVPVRREGRSEVGGIVHDESASGATLFVEPPAALELMNRLRELELAESREVLRILRRLTDALRPLGPELAASLETLVALDSLHGRAAYALRHRASRPELLTTGAGEYRVVDGRHPILLEGGEPVVPFDLELSPGERTLLVSGPNTGGKTVLLKAIGLISTLAQAGVIPPVGQGTRLPLFGDVFADIGDEQSIEASLSTFSAHLKNLREILELARSDALVLIDEIGSGTDPAEGGALAEMILVELTRRGPLTVASTHLGRLKRLAAEEPGVVNASLQFDSGELRPTYRLVKGLPGRSYGLAIARRLGFPGELVERAEELLPREEREAEQLLRELEEKERAAAEALASARGAEAEATALKTSLEERELQLARREEDAERRARQQARDLLLAAREEVESAIREVREAAAGREAEALERTARAARRRVEEAAGRQKARTPRRGGAARAAPGTLEVGTRVRLGATGATGEVLELRDGRAIVESRGLRIQVPPADLQPLPAGEAAAAPSPPPDRSWSGAEPHASPEVDLRGLRADEVAARLQPALDAAVVAELPSLRVIHGKGTGALREVVQELLAADGRVRGLRPGGVGEGGSGVTVAELR